jgi:hypothetical protein
MNKEKRKRKEERREKREREREREREKERKRKEVQGGNQSSSPMQVSFLNHAKEPMATLTR